jgi:hypothetical protein
MGYKEVLGYQNVDMNDVKVSVAEINTVVCNAMDARKTIIKKYILQNCPYKVGQKFIICTTKGKYKVVKLKKIKWDTIKQCYFYMFTCGKKKYNSNHITDMVSI